MRASSFFRLLGVAVLLSLAACGSSSGGPPAAAKSPSVAASPSAPALPAELVAGVYYVYEHPHAPATLGSSDGLLFVDGTHATLRQVVLDNEATEHDTLAIAGDQLTFSKAQPGTDPCHTPDVGVYRWTVSGKVLRLQVVHETCEVRQAMLTGHDLTM